MMIPLTWINGGRAMKKHLLIAAAVAALMTCACSVEPVDVVDVLPEEDGEITVLTAGFAGDETRTVRQADGKVFWSPMDEISVVRGTQQYGKKFVSSNTQPAPTASFTGTMPAGSGAFWALHPYYPYAYFDGTYLVTEIHSEQDGVPGSFGDNDFVSVAYSTTDDLTFYHVCGGIKFSVVDPDITKITLRANGDRAISGVIGIVPNGGHPVIQATGTLYDTVVMTPQGGTFQPGAAYHFVVLPNSLNSGFFLLLERKDGAIAYVDYNKSVTIQTAHFATLMEADKHVTWEKDIFTYSPESFSVSGLGGTVTINFRSMVDYEIHSASEWITFKSIDGDPRLREGAKASFLVEQNPGDEREGYIIVCNNKTGNCYPVSVKQASGTGLKKVTHHSLGMRFTADWCGWCPYMNESFNKAKTLLGDRFDYVNLHVSSSALAFSGTNYWASLFQVTGLPTGIIDGRVKIANNTDTDGVARTIAAAVDEQENLYPVQTAVGLKSTLSGQNLTVQAEVFARKAGSYKLTVYLLESGVVYPQSGGGSTYVHNRIGRLSLTNSGGDTVTVAEDNGSTVVNLSASIPAGYDLANMDILAFVQCPYGSQAVVQSGNYGTWYIDNCRSVSIGGTAQLEVE